MMHGANMKIMEYFLHCRGSRVQELEPCLLGMEHQSVLVFKGDGYSADISTTDLPYVMKGEAEEVEVSLFLFFIFCFVRLKGMMTCRRLGCCRSL